MIDFDEPSFFGTPGASGESGLSESYLNKLRGTDDGPPFIKVGRRVIYNRDLFFEWLMKHQQVSTTCDSSKK